MRSRRAFAAASLALAASGSVASAAQQLFSTTLHGSPAEIVEPGTPGAATMQLQPWLTDYDPDVRGPHVCARAVRGFP